MARFVSRPARPGIPRPGITPGARPVTKPAQPSRPSTNWPTTYPFGFQRGDDRG